jgi:tripartite-type tricarboxylate transporter receptor subunit TctC
MKKILTAAVTALGLAASTVAATAADWTPPGPIKLMIAFAAGGGADTQARLIAEELEARTGWQFIPEQVTGKGGVNLLRAMKDEPADGSVIGMVVTESLGYNLYAADAGMTAADFTPIVTTAGFQMGVVALTSKGWSSFDDVVAAAKAGEELRFGTMSPRLADLAYLLGKAQGVEFNIISVRGGKAVMDGVNAGDMDLGFMAGIQAKGVAAGDLVNLASALSTPLVQTPDAPTFADLGMTYDSDGYFMFAGPGGMDPAARDAMATAIAEIVSDEGTKPGGLIKKAFGGPSIIQGADLDALVQKGFDESEALINAASE